MEKILKYVIWSGLLVIPFIPLIVNSEYYYPFIVPKTLVFKVIVELIFLAFLGLAIIKKEYRPKLNLVVILFFLYIIIVSFSSLLANTFYYSFWSNNERSEGILLLLYLFVYLVILSSFLRRLKDWLAIFEISFFSSFLLSLYSLGQYFHLESFMTSSGGERLTATIGNAGYLAGYLIFNIFFGLILLFFRKNKYLRGYYSLAIFLQIFIALNTLSRGGILALIFSLAVFVVYFIFFHLKNNKLVKNSGIIFLLLILIFIIFVFSNREKDWVQKNEVLERIVSISYEATTAQNRLMTWNSAYQGFKEKPILGYGYENFYQVFDKYFNPRIYRHANSVIWFDRAHNIIFDRLITGGLVGLFLYLGLLFLPLIYLWKHFLKDKETDKYLIPFILTLAMMAYFIQNLFIFEALVTYIPLFIVLAFLAQFTPNWFNDFSRSRKVYVSLLTVSIILFLPFIFIFNVKPVAANKDFIKGLIKANTKEYIEAYDQVIDVLDRDTNGNQEYRQHLGEIVSGTIGLEQVDQDWLVQASLRTEQEFNKQIEEKPLSARNYLMFMRFLNKTYRFDVTRLDRALELGEKAIKLSPNKPHTYQEMAYSFIYLGEYYKFLGQLEKSEQFFNQSIASMQKTIALQDQAVESYVNMIIVLFITDRSQEVQAYLDKMDQMELNYHHPNFLERMVNPAVRAQNYSWTLKFYKELTEVAPEKPEYWVSLALSYAYLGQEEQAITMAEKLQEFGDEYARQSDLFIQEIKDGKFKQ